MGMRVAVIVLASISGVCGLATVHAAWAELRRVQVIRDRMMTPADPVHEALSRRPFGVISQLAVERTVTAVKEQWTPSKWSMAVVTVITPLSIVTGTAAAIVSVL